MKKAISIIISAVIAVGILIIPNGAKAATADSKAGIVSVTSGWLNVRSSASASSAIVTTLQKGSYITLLSKTGAWWYVEYDSNKYGYCHSDYISVVSSNAATVNTSYGNLNVRSGPDTSYKVITKLAKGKTVVILSTSNGWCRILYNGTKTGYVSAQYLSAVYSAVTLNVPSYKQSDSRWANVKIGSSGKTISQIGCATTAISMLESYRTGTVIYPDAMSKKLNYTQSGSVYWPSHYTVVSNSSDYLSRIYNQLKSGKAVLFGVKNTNGNQHWVVITGFTGGSLTASNFKINDPGSNTRTTLQQLLNNYPQFYKYFTY